MQAGDPRPAASLDGERPPNNLPVPVSSFIGRQSELDETKRLMNSNRLVTLTGVGGCGKTWLARQLAAELLPQFPDGAWLILLSPLRDPVLIPEVVATVIGVRPQAERPLISLLTEHFKPRHTLLLLDNCEHLIDGAAALAAELLQSAPGLKILATSRERLNIDGETVWPVPPLSTPDPRKPFSFQELIRFDAVQFFADRATAFRPDFQLTEVTAPVIASIAHRVDGMPLALELAAACIRFLSVNQIAERLSNSFELLMDGRRTAPDRQATLRQAIDWTHDLLAEAERQLWYRLAVFAADFSLEEAEQVCSGQDMSAQEVRGLVARLVDKSVVVAVERGGAVRYRLLATIRQYGGERLRALGQEAYWRARLPGATRAEVFMSLSDRERAVAALVAEGLSRVEMGQRLCISPFTVDRYLQQIYDKLQLPSRSKAELAAWAIRAGLGRT